MTNIIPVLASELPPPCRCTCFESMANAYCCHSPGLRQAKSVVNGESTELAAILNYNARMVELIAKYGSCDMYAVAHGLDIVAGEGIQAIIQPGHAFGETILEAHCPQKVTLWDNAVTFIWFGNDSNAHSETAMSQPQCGGVYLGCVSCQDGQIVEVSTLGRFDLRAGNVVRRTLDPDRPEDSPTPEPSWFYTVTDGGVFLWTGERYSKVGD